MTKMTVLLTDYAWEDDSIERSIIETAGYVLISGPSAPSSRDVIEDLVKEHQPSAILTCWAEVSPAAIASSRNLEIVARLGVGLDNIAVSTATERGIWVTNVPDYCVEEVSDHAIAFVLAWTRGISHFDREVRAGHWEPSTAKLRRLSTLTCGIVGFGRIGQGTARKLQAFGCSLVAYDPYPPKDSSGVEMLSLDDVLAKSDIVIVHAPLTENTHHLIGARELGKVKKGALLINVSRGGVVDTAALMSALEEGRLSAVGLDVLEEEPAVPSELRDHPGSMITPHVAFSSDASLVELRTRAAEEVVRVLKGDQPNRPCNKPNHS